MGALILAALVAVPIAVVVGARGPRATLRSLDELVGRVFRRLSGKGRQS